VVELRKSSVFAACACFIYLLALISTLYYAQFEVSSSASPTVSGGVASGSGLREELPVGDSVTAKVIRAKPSVDLLSLGLFSAAYFAVSAAVFAALRRLESRSFLL
jgi:hypothetical protein